MNVFRIASIALFCCVSMSSAYARQLSDQRAVFASKKSDTEYRLALSSIKTVNARLVAEREVLLFGDLHRTTYEFDRGMKLSEAWRLLETSYEDAAYQELFRCDALACGSSNAWANSRFGIKQLYGLNQTQKYRVLLNKSINKYVVMYFVQRGNKRIYAQVDQLVSNGSEDNISPSASTIASQIERVGYYALAPVAAKQSFSDEQLEQVVSVLKRQPISRFFLVGHCYQFSNFDQNLACGETLASGLAKKLHDQGVKANRLELRSVGSLVPREAIPRNRVELVLKGRALWK